MVRTNAARALYMLKNPIAIEALIDALKDGHSYYVRDTAEAALVAITGEDFGQESQSHS